MLPVSPELSANTTLVVLAAGRGERFGGQLPKHLAPIHGVPLIVRLIGQCSGSFATTPVVVVHSSDSETPAVLSEWHLNVNVAVQTGGRGTVPAVLAALPMCAENVCVVLADLVVDGLVRGVISEQPAIIVWPSAPADTTRRNFGVRIRRSSIAEVVEKPEDPTGLACGIGVYLFSADLVLALAPRVTSDSRGERGITDLLSAVISSGIVLSVHEFDGVYVNVNDQNDLAAASRWTERH